MPCWPHLCSQLTKISSYRECTVSTGYPGTNQTLLLLQEHFWWPEMAWDDKRFIQSCRECAMSKTPRHLPSGKLLLLPVPFRPWSHLGVNFISDTTGIPSVTIYATYSSILCHSPTCSIYDTLDCLYLSLSLIVY